MDRNLLHISFEAGILEDPWLDAFAPEHKGMYKLSAFRPKTRRTSRNTSRSDFEKGNCVAVNGKETESRSA